MIKINFKIFFHAKEKIPLTNMAYNYKLLYEISREEYYGNLKVTRFRYSKLLLKIKIVFF